MSGQVDAIRTHLQRYHRDDFEDSVLKFRLKGHEELASRRASSSAMQSSSLAEILATRTLAEKFTVNGFRERLARWVVTDDQVQCYCLSVNTICLLLSCHVYTSLYELSTTSSFEISSCTASGLIGSRHPSCRTAFPTEQRSQS